LAVGVWNGFDELAALRRSQCVFRPQREEEACLADLARWHRAVERSRSWIENNV
jgi:glycerol kinase